MAFWLKESFLAQSLITTKACEGMDDEIIAAEGPTFAPDGLTDNIRVLKIKFLM